MSILYDVVIVGAGPGGSAAAHFLARGGLHVLLLDKAEFPRDKTCGDGLTPRALSVLNKMDLMPELDKVGFRIDGVEMHSRSGEEMLAPIPKHPAYPNNLMIVPRYQLDEIVSQRAIEVGVDFERAKVHGLTQDADQAFVHARFGGKEITYKGRIVILAIGANTALLQSLGFIEKQPRVMLAARAYYEDVQDLTSRVQVHFGAVPIPGYGWVFPTSETSANVGVAFWPTRLARGKLPSSARLAFDDFVSKNAKLTVALSAAKQTRPLKSYPIRIDFAKSRISDRRILLVGEAAGLVSPLTGEGIDFALESGMLAANFLAWQFESGDISPDSLSGYDAVLRQKFQKLFTFLDRLRYIYVNSWLIDRSILAASKRDDINKLMIDILLSYQDGAKGLYLSTFRKVVLGI